MRKFYWLSNLGVMALYGSASAFGWGISDGPREKLSADARTSPGGYRSYHFWHSGFRGGK